MWLLFFFSQAFWSKQIQSPPKHVSTQQKLKCLFLVFLLLTDSRALRKRKKKTKKPPRASPSSYSPKVLPYSERLQLQKSYILLANRGLTQVFKLYALLKQFQLSVTKSLHLCMTFYHTLLHKILWFLQTLKLSVLTWK